MKILDSNAGKLLNSFKKPLIFIATVAALSGCLSEEEKQKKEKDRLYQKELRYKKNLGDGNVSIVDAFIDPIKEESSRAPCYVYDSFDGEFVASLCEVYVKDNPDRMIITSSNNNELRTLYSTDLVQFEQMKGLINSGEKIQITDKNGNLLYGLRKRGLTHSTHPILNINHIFSLFH